MNRPSPRYDVPSADSPVRQGATAPTHAYVPFAGHPPALVASALDRILASRTFRRSQRHKDFLRHVVDAALGNHHEVLREIVIGIEIFGRDVSTFDPRRDPIVRVEAGRVREKLARYYADEGVDDAFEVQIPVGGYLPQLSRRVAAKAPARNLGSFAVLPFTNLSSRGEDAIFCEALADQVIDQLSRAPGVRVVGRMSAIKARSKSVDTKVVGKLLGVNHVIEGSVQRAGTRYRCIAQVSRTRDRVCIWSQRFECDVGQNADLFAFQDRIADAVTVAVTQPTITTPTTPIPTTLAPSGSASARDLYERARYLLQVRSNEGLEKGIALLEQSIALDQDFAPAHSQLGAALSRFYGVMARPTLPAFREVERCARRALELDPLDGDARSLIANIAFRVDRDWARAEPLFLDALRVSPNSTGAHQAYAAALAFNGRYLEAIQHARIALDLDPLNIHVRVYLGVVTAYARDYPTSIEEFKVVLDIEPGHLYGQFMLGSVYLWAGVADLAMKHFDLACAIAPDHPIAHFDRVMAHGLMGDFEGGRKLLAEVLARFEGKHYQLYNRAMAEAYLGDVEALCATLRRTAAVHELLFVSLPADPSFDPYRDHPMFIALMNEFGLPRLPPSPFAAPFPVAA